MSYESRMKGSYRCSDTTDPSQPSAQSAQSGVDPSGSRTIADSSKRIHFSLEDNKCYHQTRVVDIWALGITIVIGGQYFNWNEGLSAGFGSYAICTLLIGIAYICLCLCTSELSSALPFAGERIIIEGYVTVFCILHDLCEFYMSCRVCGSR